MSVTTTSHEELNHRARVAYARTRTLLETTDPALRLTGGGWSCGDVAAHLLNVMCRYTHRDLTQPSGLSAQVSDLAGQNSAEVAAVRGLSHDEVLQRLDSEFDDYISRTPLPLGQRFPFHGGVSIDGAGAASNWIGELLVHGFDVARTARTPWPLAARDAVLVLNGALQVVPAWVDTTTAPDALDVAVHVRGGTPPSCCTSAPRACRSVTDTGATEPTQSCVVPPQRCCCSSTDVSACLGLSGAVL